MSISRIGELSIPEFSLVLLVGASGSGKSTFARKHFLATEIASSDVCRGLVSDDENSQEATADAFALLQSMVDGLIELMERAWCYAFDPLPPLDPPLCLFEEETRTWIMNGFTLLLVPAAIMIGKCMDNRRVRRMQRG